MNHINKDKNYNLKQKAVSSSGWGFLDKGSNVIAQFLIGIVLARLLPPSDFGLIGLAMIVIGFGQIFVNLGLGPALIHKQNISERHIRVVFTTSLIAGIILMILVFTSAPLVAVIFNNENVIPVVKVLSVIFVIAGFQVPSQAILKKELDFRNIFYVSFGKSILYGIVSIALALFGFGVWSLVIGSIIQRLISLLGSYWYIRHSLKPLFAQKEILDLAHFGSGMTLNGIFNYFALKGDYFMIGRILGTEALGLYTKAYNLMQAPTSQFVSVLSDVLFPTASKIQSDSDRVRSVFLKTMQVIAFVTIPFCSLMILIAPEFIVGLYGENWKGAVVPFQILGGFGVFRAMYNAGGSFLRAKGWVYGLFGANICYGITMLTGVWLASNIFGLNGAAWAVGFAICVIWGIIMELNCRSMNIKRLEIIQLLIPGIIIGAAIVIPIIILKGIFTEYLVNNLIGLLIFGVLGVILFLSGIFLLPQKSLNFIPYELLTVGKQFIPDKFSGVYSIMIRFIKMPRK